MNGQTPSDKTRSRARAYRAMSRARTKLSKAEQLSGKELNKGELLSDSSRRRTKKTER